ncbi:Putative NADH-flavin reductase [Actinobacillus pleuropneumoniae]|nr:Putative NADH-flavin reductase [Actinobacillus pleuropneumoniae]
MKALFIGGTGTISTAITKQLLEQGCELYLLNRGNRNDTLPEGAHILQADIHDEDQVAKLIEHLDFDVVADFIAFEPAHLERDYRLLEEKPNNSFLSARLQPIKRLYPIIALRKGRLYPIRTGRIPETK